MDRRVVTAWMADAACVGTDPESFFPDPRITPPESVVRVCRGCPVREECLRHALDRPYLDGIWGGLGPGQRQLLRRSKSTPDYYEPRKCAWCGAQFPVTHGLRKYCSRKCGNNAHDFRSGRRRTGPPAIRGG